MMIVCRAILDMGVTAAEFKELSGNGWNAHRSCIRKAWIRDPAAYRARVAACVQLAKQANADILLLPACALVGDVASWMPLLSALPFVVAGTLSFGVGVGRPRYFEAAAVVREGKLAEAFDNAVVVHQDLESVAVYAAISSSVGRIAHVAGHQRALVLDAGHHAYGGRYRKVLSRVARVAAGTKGEAVAVLAFWKATDSTTAFQWFEAASCSVRWSRVRTDDDIVDLIFT